MTQNSQAMHDELRSLALWLLEMSTRAGLDGATTMAVPLTTVANMAQAVFRAVLVLEQALGSTGGTPPAPTTGMPAIDATSLLGQLTEQANLKAAEIQRQVLEDLKKQFAAQQPVPASGPPVQPSPTVPG